MKRLIYTSVTFMFAIFTTYNLQAEVHSAISNDLFIYCPTDVMSGTDPGMCSAIVYYDDPIAIDSMGVTIIQTQGFPSGSEFPKGETYNRFEATDMLGNMSECGFYVFVDDFELPTIYCENNVTLNLDSTGYALVNAEDIGIQSWDNCGIDYMELSQTEFTALHLGENVVTLTVMDSGGNSNVCTALVTVLEPNELTVVCPSDITLNSDEMMCSAYVNEFYPDIDSSSPNVYVIYEISGATTGEGSFDVSGTMFNMGSSTVIYTISDDFGNSQICSSEVNIIDAEAPYISDPGGYELPIGDECMIELPDFTSEIEAWDNCGNVMIEQYPEPGTMLKTGENGVEFIVTDEAGNMNYTVMYIYVHDATQPLIVCQNAIVTLNNNGYGILTTDELITEAWDNCGIANVFASNLEFNETDIGQNEVTLTIMDFSGNTTSCTSIVTVEENEEDDIVIGDLDFDVYPNPTLGDVTIDLPRDRPGFSARVADFTGKLIYEIDFGDESKFKINLEDLDAGIYTISVFNENLSATKTTYKNKIKLLNVISESLPHGGFFV